VRRRRGHGLEAVHDLAAHQVGEERAAALVRHVQRVDAGLQLEHLEREVLRRSLPGRAEGDLAGLGLAAGDDVGNGERLLRRVGDQQVGRDADQHDRNEVLLDAVAQLRLQAGRQAVAVDVRHQQRRAVARLLRGVLGGEHAGDAGLGLDDDLLVPHLRQLGGDDAGERIGAAAGGKADDDADRAVRPFLGEQARRGEGGDGGAAGLEEGASLHSFGSCQRSGKRGRSATRRRG
jgi:hypothetical protein